MYWLFSSKHSNSALQTGLLLLRIIVGVTMLFHGYEKLVGFNTMSASDFWNNNVNFLGMGGKVSLGLVVFAEFFCSLFIIFGIATRFAAIVLIICMAYAFFVTHHADFFERSKEGAIEGIQSSLQYVIWYIIIFLIGPGNYSLDKLLLKK